MPISTNNMLPHFHTLYLETTRSCNLSCKYCSTGSNGKFDNSDDMTFDEIVNRILYPAYELGTRFINLSGGEFLLRKDAYDLLLKANKIGFRISIVSNGTTLNEKNIQKLKTILGDNLLISLGVDSFDKNNKSTRQITSGYILKKIYLLEKNYIGINICVTIGKFNTHSFSDTVKNIRELKLPFNRIPFVIRNCNSCDLMYNSDILRKYFHPTLRRQFHGSVSYTPHFLSPDTYENATGQTEKNDMVPTNPSIGCWCGSFYGINPEGDVSVCPLLLDNVSAGNVLTEDLRQILTESDQFKRILQRDSFGGKCGNCQYRFTCGGCRALAYYKTGDVFGEDPTCFIDDLSEKELCDIEKETEKSFKNYIRMATFGKVFTLPT
ncbi:MAG: radical SAM protein [Bacteroidota bacterium]